MNFEIGIACGACDTYNPMGEDRCTACSHELLLYRQTSSVSNLQATKSMGAPVVAPLRIVPAEPAPAPAPAPPKEAPSPSPSPKASPAKAAVPKRPTAPDLALHLPVDARASAKASPTVEAMPVSPSVPASSPKQRREPPSYANLTQEELMDQARHYLCWQCFTPVPTGHKFCGRCGAEVPEEITNARTLFFSDMQNPSKARLIVIRGEGMDGVAYHLKMEQHLVGKSGHVQIPFADDPFVSPTHANFFYRDNKLFVRDEGSLNGVYLRVRGSVDIAGGDTYLAGEQVFRLDPTPRASDGQDPDGTFFYSSPKYPSPFRITQILQGGALGMTVCARGSSLQLGREGGDLNFPADIYMSSSHCRIEEAGGKFTLTDLNSRNGTYVRLKTERELGHGDYIFVGRKLMRVEMTA